ncbi:MAG TPA: type II toxin-antitoxin system PemK/MazF family toxin [Rhizomicrobium sp.]|nr:type II toxin-antitoxin system PemK/MazF family toxin [Rhizomicrobium sp.]
MTICDGDDVAVVPFPFTDVARSKPRPALTLSTRAANAASGQTVFAMITTAAASHWPSDVALSDLASCGLSHPSVVRFKLFTLDNRLIARRIGALSPADRTVVRRALRAVLGL